MCCPVEVKDVPMIACMQEEATQDTGVRPCRKVVCRRSLKPRCKLVSNRGMDTSQDTARDTDRRLTDLEIKASFGEDLLEELNRVVIRQQQQIDLLLREVSQLRQQIPEAGTRQPGRPTDDLPPHY